jgi:hypothetical protein
VSVLSLKISAGNVQIDHNVTNNFYKLDPSLLV